MRSSNHREGKRESPTHNIAVQRHYTVESTSLYDLRQHQGAYISYVQLSSVQKSNTIVLTVTNLLVKYGKFQFAGFILAGYLRALAADMCTTPVAETTDVCFLKCLPSLLFHFLMDILSKSVLNNHNNSFKKPKVRQKSLSDRSSSW